MSPTRSHTHPEPHLRTHDPSLDSPHSLPLPSPFSSVQQMATYPSSASIHPAAPALPPSSSPTPPVWTLPRSHYLNKPMFPLPCGHSYNPPSPTAALSSSIYTHHPTNPRLTHRLTILRAAPPPLIAPHPILTSQPSGTVQPHLKSHWSGLQYFPVCPSRPTPPLTLLIHPHSPQPPPPLPPPNLSPP